MVMQIKLVVVVVVVDKAPWWGGFWERLVQTVKRPLKKVIGRSSPSFEAAQYPADGSGMCRQC